MEVSKVKFHLPIVIKGSKKTVKHFERELCSPACLFQKFDSFLFAIPGGNQADDRSSFLFVTESQTIIKKRKYMADSIWSEFGYQYEINRIEQQNILSKLMKSPLPGLVSVIGLCDCAMETPYINGVLAETNTNPLVNYHYENYVRMEQWTEDVFWTYVDSALKALKNFHSNGIVHGDPCAHNILLSNAHEPLFIDLDTLTSANRDKIERDICIFLFFGVMPLAKRVLSDSKYEMVMGNILGSFAEIDVVDINVDILRKDNPSPKSSYHFFSWYLNFLSSNLKKSIEDNTFHQFAIRQLKVNVMETSRIFTLKLEKQEHELQERLKLIEKLSLQIQEIEDDRAKRLEVIEALNKQLVESEEDRAKRLKIIQELHQQVIELEGERSKKLELIETYRTLEEDLIREKTTSLNLQNQVDKLIEMKKEDRKRFDELEQIIEYSNNEKEFLQQEKSSLEQRIHILELEKSKYLEIIQEKQCELDTINNNWLMKIIKK